MCYMYYTVGQDELREQYMDDLIVLNSTIRSLRPAFYYRKRMVRGARTF